MDTISSGVIWITGYSASGKTTVGRLVTEILSGMGKAAIFLDGDDLRSIFSGTWGYSREERIDLAHVYLRLCSHLSSQGHIVVISTVALYHEVFSWFTQNIPAGIQVFLDVPETERIKRDALTKGLYQKNRSFQSTYDSPDHIHIKINNHNVSPNSVAEKIACLFMQQAEGKADFGRSAHWNQYYKTHNGTIEPSPFSLFVNSKLSHPASIIEIGCGNGRDAVALSKAGHRVTALDLSAEAIAFCKQHHKESEVIFDCQSLEQYVQANPTAYNVVYSRFSLHAMPLAEEVGMLGAAYQALQPNGMLFIECRSINDPLARKGEVISPTERIYGHYRRFIILNELITRVQRSGFEVVFSIEAKGLAVTQDEDPVIIRLIAQRKT